MIVECPHLVLEDFLPDDALAELRAFARASDEELREATVYKPGSSDRHHDESYRRSRVGFDIEQVWDMFDAPLRGLLPIVRSELGVPHFPLGDIERQMTVTEDGGFFRRHADENNPMTDGCRVLTFVYYFHTDPSAFDGGTLRLYSRRDDHGTLTETDEYIELTPQPNSVVFFPADWHHEVMPLEAVGNDAERWTINGWFHAGDLGRPVVPFLSPAVNNLVSRHVVPTAAAGFALRPTPGAVDRLLRARWELDADSLSDEPDDEQFGIGGVRGHLPIGGLADDLLRRLKPLHEAWAGQPLLESAAYGLRVFRRGQGIGMHVDTTATHVVSSMVFVAVDAQAPFTLTLDDAARRHLIVPQTGQMLFYEGARMPHGHLTPLDGEHVAVLYLHYRPVEWNLDDREVARLGVEQGWVDVHGQPTDLALAPGGGA